MMKFTPAYWDGESVLGNSVFSFVETFAAYENSGVSAWDMAVLKLRDPLGRLAGYFGSKTFDKSWENNFWNHCGYCTSFGNGNRPSYQNNIQIHNTVEDGAAMELISDNEDCLPGDSGGPLFAIWPDGFPYVVGSVSGVSELPLGGGWWGLSPEQICVNSGGSALVDLINWGRANW
jgi:hypothetical protein